MATAEAVGTFRSGGLGVDRELWERAHGPPEGESSGAVFYSDGRLRVRFEGDRVESVERLWTGEPPAALAAARRHSRDFLPRDARSVPTRAERAGHPVDAYRSPSLRERCGTEWITVRYLGPEGRVQSMIIATFHTGDAIEPAPIAAPLMRQPRRQRKRLTDRGRALWAAARAGRWQVLVPLAVLAVVLLAIAVWRVREQREGSAAPAETPVRRVQDLPEPGLPLSFEGFGPAVTGPITLPFPVSAVSFFYAGTGSFVVRALLDGRQTPLLNVTGAYAGARPVAANSPINLDVQADGPWRVTILPLRVTLSPATAGRGDTVSGLFDPPPPGDWEFDHSGSSTFTVTLHCAGGNDVARNQTGTGRSTKRVEFPTGPCYWEVQADGQWVLQPR